MAKTKVYTEKDIKNPAIKAMLKAGFKSITITWESALSRNRGWTVQADGKWILRAYSIDNLLEKINKIRTHDNERNC